MKIVYLAAGAAGMYCGSCLHDNTLAAALLARGEDLLLVPTYTPIRTDEVDVSQRRVFLGGINMYLQQKVPLLRRVPKWLDRWLNNPWLLRWATSGAASVDPKQLGEMTVSMLRGEEGNQRKELSELANAINSDWQPDIVHLSNSMMMGIAGGIARNGSSKIVCSLSGEDIFLEKLVEPHYSLARGLLTERAQDIDAFVALNDYYADFMADYLQVPREKVHVVPHGIDLTGYDTIERTATESKRLSIGYLARICHDKGLHRLVEAAEQLAGDSPELDFEIVAAGYLGDSDRDYLQSIVRQCERGRLAGRFRYEGEVDRAEKLRLLASCDLFALPTVYRESKGLSVLEALATGTPVVLPDHGSFPELVTATGGGLLYPAGDQAALAARIGEMLNAPDRRQKLGVLGREAVHERFHAGEMARRTVALYENLLA